MILPCTKIAEDEKHTIKIASEFASCINPGDLVALTGDLGAGKTFFVKAVCAGLGIENVTSPTFSIVNEYSGKYLVNHFDFYRINTNNLIPLYEYQTLNEIFQYQNILAINKNLKFQL